MKLVKLRFFYFLCLLCTINVWAQNITVSGKVSDENGLPVPGASVFVKGTNVSSVTDIDGNYQIEAPSSGTLEFSYIGYATQDVALNGQTTVNITLTSEAQNLDEVVVVGYGTQKKSVVTGAISSVKAKQLEDLPLTRIEQSLQGRTSGVTIFANAGQPGSAYTVRIRGIASFNGGSNDPLWVVDGVIVDNGGVQLLNQADIESIEVLKDAASAAIYGARGATGVILITTKKGKSGKMAVNYNGFTGFSGPARKLDLLNAEQYAALRNEQAVNSGATTLPFPNVGSYGNGTDWQDEIFNDNAQRSQHELSVSGGNDKSTYYLSFSLTDQEGIVATDISNYNRKTIRLNSTHKVNSWLNIGESASYVREKALGIGNTNSEYGGPLASAINLDPTTPVFVTDPSTRPNASDYAQEYALQNSAGQYYGISHTVQQEMTNPLAYVETHRGNYSWADNIIGDVYAEVMPIEGLKWRTEIGGKKAYYGSQSFSPISYLGPNSNTVKNSLYRGQNENLRWNLDNTLSYNKLIGGHNFTIMLGQGVYEENIGFGSNITYQNQPVNNVGDASFNWPTAADDRDGSAYTNDPHRVTSLFARLNYDYKEKYLLTGIVRRDGSSRFGANNRYGTFPSFSLGWVPTKEDFWKENDVVNQLKIRAGYGITGNDNIGDFGADSYITGGNNYTIGYPGTVIIGNGPNRPANPDLKWEETTQKDLGFDAVLFRDFTLGFDYYYKKTTGILQSVNPPDYIGATEPPLGNVGEMKNTGFEFELGYNKKVGDLNIGFNGNLSTLKNTVTNVGADREFNDGPGVQSSLPVTRSEPGHSINEFYGFVMDGIFQNQEQINNYVNADGNPIQPDAQPGDVIWRDLNGDGEITNDDRTYLGKSVPTLTFAATLDLAYKGFDFKVFGQGVSGNKIYQGIRRLDMVNANWQTDALNRWTGEGSTNSYPRLSTNDNNGNFSRNSKLHLEDGDYFRIKIVQLGYSLPQKLIEKASISKVRLYVTAENLFTFTKYTGFDPEIGGNVFGIDRGYYPQARSFMVGCNLQF